MISSQRLDSYGADRWRRMGAEKRAGLLAPLFSLHSKRSAGVGDLEDLKLAVDWCVQTGHTILQLLPMGDYYISPYSTTSLFAIEPMYMALDRLEGIAKEAAEPYIQQIRQKYPIGGKGYMNTHVKVAKLNALRNLFQLALPLECAAFSDYVADNRYWLEDYALFSALKTYYSTDCWESWEPRYRDREPAALQQFSEEQETNILFVKWVQWQLYEQLKAAKAYANASNVRLMGDLFYVSGRECSDVWARTPYFRLDLVPGVPPEPAHVKGQRWGDQPIYNWKAIIADDCELYRERLRYNAHFFDVMRIDAISLMFKMWCIPKEEPNENEGLNGFNYPGTDEEQEEQGRKLLTTMLGSTNMLLCAENLGPFCLDFIPLVRSLGIPIFSFQRWDKDWDGTEDFILPENTHPLTIHMISNQDTSVWWEWWENEAGMIERSCLTKFCMKAGRIGAELQLRELLFDEARSTATKLRWRESVDSHDKLAELLGMTKSELFVYELYREYLFSYREKEKVWAIIGLEGPIRESCDHDILSAAIRSVLSARGVWSIISILEYLCMLDIIEGDYESVRYNRPGTVGNWNWSITSPLSLEELLEESYCSKVRALVEDSVTALIQEGIL
ncbi:hypothetical protein PAECIP111893_00120 [Paenibacillus plantiphilus]|uniref:4-alpha-glucanotransferase n=1 Tax=Paenibacillus plantiphilus TaxID=2905650 RepID=A0ABN8FPX2_9BACL|nr:4-alpha-glucanotransferase [Paenibacillus plantiphilus]CAH1190036.1 hypothetical protein PAECIP111893_00120 [Paenibacillus plantiphilus]